MPDDLTEQIRLRVDVAKYQAMIDDPNLNDEEKRAFIEALWQIVVTFVDLGLGLHPVQRACGQLTRPPQETDLSPRDVLDCPDQPTDQFNNTAAKAGKDESV